MRTELGHAVAQHRRVERHVDARHVEERVLRRRPAPGVERLLQRVERPQRARHRVLLAAQVVVDDLEGLTEACGEVPHQLLDLCVVHVDLVGSDDAQAVVGTTIGVAGHQVVHRLTTTEDQLDDHLERQHAAERRQRVVLTDGVTCDDGGLVDDPLVAQLGELRHGERRHGDLRELRQVQHAERVPVHLGVAVGCGHRDDGRVVAHDRQDREPEVRPGVRVRSVPHVTRRGGSLVAVHAHALALDALTGEQVRSTRRCDAGAGGEHRHGAVGAGHRRGDAVFGVALDDTEAGHDEADLITGQYDADERRRDVDQALGTTAARGLDQRALCTRRGPGAVHDRAVESHEASDGGRAVDRIVVARDHGELAQVLGCPQDQLRQRQAGPLLQRGRRVGGVPFRCRRVGRGGDRLGALRLHAPQQERSGHDGDRPAVGRGDRGACVDARAGLVRLGGGQRCGDRHGVAGCVAGWVTSGSTCGGQRVGIEDLDAVLQVHEVEQRADDGVVTEAAEDLGPDDREQRVGQRRGVGVETQERGVATATHGVDGGPTLGVADEHLVQQRRQLVTTGRGVEREHVRAVVQVVHEAQRDGLLPGAGAGRGAGVGRAGAVAAQGRPGDRERHGIRVRGPRFAGEQLDRFTLADRARIAARHRGGRRCVQLCCEQSAVGSGGEPPAVGLGETEHGVRPDRAVDEDRRRGEQRGDRAAERCDVAARDGGRATTSGHLGHRGRVGELVAQWLFEAR